MSRSQAVRNRLALALVLAPSCWGLAQGLSPSATLEWYKGRGDYLVPGIREELRKGLTPAERSIEMGITYDVIATWNANAQAVELNDGPHSGIGAGFIAVIDWVATAMAIDYKFHNNRCASAYIHSLSDAILQNSHAAAGTGRYAIIGSPFAFAQSSPALCPGVTEAGFRADRHADDLREQWIRGSLEYVLAHELGHHVLGHTATPPANYPESRQREAKADAFAFRVMAKAGVNPLLSLPVMLLWCDLEGFSIEGEGTHPAGVRRMRVMVAAARQAVNDDPEVQAAMHRDGTRAQWDTAIQKMDSMLNDAENQ
jgi:hypothetical protein